MKTSWLANARAASLVVAAMLVTSGCVSTYNRSFQPTPGIPDQYTFRVYVSGASEAFTGTRQSDERAEEEIRKFMGEHGYEGYEVVNRTKTTIPTSYFEYTVAFTPAKAR